MADRSNKQLKNIEEQLQEEKMNVGHIQLALEKDQQQMYDTRDKLDLLRDKMDFYENCFKMRDTEGEGKEKQNTKDTAVIQDPKDSLIKEDVFLRRTKEYLLKVLKTKISAAHSEHEDDLRLTFGTKASFQELYTKGNMIKVNVSLFTKKITGLTKEISILTSFENTLADVRSTKVRFFRCLVISGSSKPKNTF